MKIRSGEINKQDLEDCMVIPLLIQIMVLGVGGLG